MKKIIENSIDKIPFQLNKKTKKKNQSFVALKETKNLRNLAEKTGY